MDAKIQAALEAGAQQLGVTLDSTHLARFDRYLDALLRWNTHIKLTSVTAPADVVEKHVLDSLAVVPALGSARELVDIGSGAGFPGLVVAAVRPEIRVTVVESIQKKAAFLEHMEWMRTQQEELAREQAPPPREAWPPEMLIFLARLFNQS